jgi:hypothetical protein
VPGFALGCRRRSGRGRRLYSVRRRLAHRLVRRQGHGHRVLCSREALTVVCGLLVTNRAAPPGDRRFDLFEAHRFLAPWRSLRRAMPDLAHWTATSASPRSDPRALHLDYRPVSVALGVIALTSRWRSTPASHLKRWIGQRPGGPALRHIRRLHHGDVSRHSQRHRHQRVDDGRLPRLDPLGAGLGDVSRPESRAETNRRPEGVSTLRRLARGGTSNRQQLRLAAPGPSHLTAAEFAGQRSPDRSALLVPAGN